MLRSFTYEYNIIDDHPIKMSYIKKGSNHSELNIKHIQIY